MHPPAMALTATNHSNTIEEMRRIFIVLPWDLARW